jgi:hypothetical protein
MLYRKFGSQFPVPEALNPNQKSLDASTKHKACRQKSKKSVSRAPSVGDPERLKGKEMRARAVAITGD